MTSINQFIRQDRRLPTQPPSPHYLRELRYWAEKLSVPRHYGLHHAANVAVRKDLSACLEYSGFRVSLQGEWDNVVAVPKVPGPYTLVAAHYDSVLNSPGADDNASALAVMLVASMLLGPGKPVAFAAFNCEEDGLLGSKDFADNLSSQGLEISGAHVLEMVGCCARTPGSQSNPLPGVLDLPDVGDFLALVGRERDHALLQSALAATDAVPGLHVLSLQVLGGVESLLPVIHRSDHSSLWAAGVPAIMWTDTAEYRNPRYHLPTDTPDTLDYAFMQKVCSLLVRACCLPGETK